MKKCILIFLLLGLGSAGAEDVQQLIEQGVAYRDGEGVKEDHAKAFDLFRRASATGDARAQDHFGWMHFMKLGTPQNFPEALKWFEKSAAQNFHQGQYNLGRFYFSGLAVEQDYARAAELWHKATENGSKHAPHNLARLYRQGWGVKQDDRQAFRFCRQAIRRGDASANLLLGLLYHEGRGREKNAAKAEAAWKAAYAEDKPENNVDMFAWRKLTQRKAEPGKFVFIQIPHDRQGYNNCAPTAAAICLSTDGKLRDPYVIKRGCKGSRTGHGTDWARLVESINALGRKAELVTFPITDDGLKEGLAFVKKELDAGRPILVDIKEPEVDSLSAHTVVAVGYDEDAGLLILHDPARGLPGIRTVNLDRLDTIWRSRWYSHSSPEISRPVIRVE